MILNRLFSAASIMLMVGVPVFAVNASVQISTTRVIYHGADKDVSVQILNPGKSPVLLQSWIDAGDPSIKPDAIQTPFVLTPPLTRVNQGAGQTLRLSFIGASLPTDRESLYWLNVLEIPPVSTAKNQNEMQVAFRSRIKLIYRPVKLDDKGANASISQLRWSAQNNKITLSNPTPYYVSLVGLTINHGGKKDNISADMIDPNKSSAFALPKGVSPESITTVTVDAINDYGAVQSAPAEKQ